MDINEAHAALVGQLDGIRAMEREGMELSSSQEAILEHFAALDEWLRSGGFLPDAWRR